MYMENTLNHIVIYEKTIFDKKIIWKCNMAPQNLKKAYCLKISQNVNYVKEYFYMFFSTPKDIIQAQSKENNWIS